MGTHSKLTVHRCGMRRSVMLNVRYGSTCNSELKYMYLYAEIKLNQIQKMLIYIYISFQLLTVTLLLLITSNF